jgi:hypothetical protein
MRLTRPAAAVFASLSVTATVLACKDNPSGEDAKCRSTLSTFTSPAPGVVTLTGHFYSDESIEILDLDASTVVAEGTPATDRTSFTFTGVPSGVRYYLIKVSCSAGQENLDEGDFTVS